MKTVDLNEEFINALYNKAPKRSNLVSRIADILKIEKEAAYRRLSGKVSFSIREMGIIAEAFGISLDNLLYNSPEYLWMPFFLESPAKLDSIDIFWRLIDNTIKSISEVCENPAEAGHLIHYIPIAFCVEYPELLKFIVFKWGYYFVATEEYLKYSDWELPQVFTTLKERIHELNNFSNVFFIWDPSIITNLVSEMNNFLKMNILTHEDIDLIKTELKELLFFMEKWLSNTEIANPPFSIKTNFYVSSVDIGFGGSYYASSNTNMVSMSTKFSYSMIHDREDSYNKVKEWIMSIRNVSVMISDSGSIERRLFFQKQLEILDRMGRES